MQRFLYTILTLLALLPIQAQQFGAEWMEAATPNDTSCLWLRRTFVSAVPLRRASVCVASNGRFRLYVNGRNVSAAVFTPACDTPYDATSMTFDVTRFLRPDSNTVALLICPSSRSASQPKASVGFFGTTARGSKFADASADGWLCHTASTSLSAGGERLDSRQDSLAPAYGDAVSMLWTPAISTPKPATPHDLGLSAEGIFACFATSRATPPDNAAYTYKILQPQSYATDGRSITCDFAPGFYGIVRVTLRGCQRGERISIGNLSYICSGETDEQAFCRFTPQYMRSVRISGDRHFTPSQVEEVEALCF